MLPTEPKVGWIFRYSYLGYWQYLQGARRATRIVRCSDPHEAIEIPPATKRSLGVDDERSRIVLTECNRLVWPGPTSGRPTETAVMGPCRRRCRRGEASVRRTEQLGRRHATSNGTKSFNAAVPRPRRAASNVSGADWLAWPTARPGRRACTLQSCGCSFGPPLNAGAW